MRTTRVRSLVCVALMALLSGCTDGDLAEIALDEFPGAARVGFETIDKGSYSGLETNGFRGEVATSPDEWGRLWANHTSNQKPASAAPEVDFASQFVVAVFMGRQHTGGHGIRVVDIPLLDGKFHTGYATARPGKGCLTSQAVTHPFHIVAVERADQTTIDVVFHNAGQNVRQC